MAELGSVDGESGGESAIVSRAFVTDYSLTKEESSAITPRNTTNEELEWIVDQNVRENPPLPKPFFSITFDQPYGPPSCESNSNRSRVLFSLGAAARFDAVIYNYFALDFLIYTALLTPSTAV
jgi:hypothetical protein